MPNVIRVKLLRTVPVGGLTLPRVDPHTYQLFDEDEKMCRVVSEDELEASYVDNHLETAEMKNFDVWNLDLDAAAVELTYSNGRKTSVQLGAIDRAPGARAKHYAKVNGFIYPIDRNGSMMLNQTNTPRLVVIKTVFWDRAKLANDQRLEIAEIVMPLADAIGILGNTRSHLHHSYGQ